jgi:hypothetical protein
VRRCFEAFEVGIVVDVGEFGKGFGVRGVGGFFGCQKFCL